MKYDILKDFKGAQDGRDVTAFEAGTVAELSDYLAGIVVPEGWAKPVGEKVAPVSNDPAEPENKAIITEDKPRRGRKPKGQ